MHGRTYLNGSLFRPKRGVSITSWTLRRCASSGESHSSLPFPPFRRLHRNCVLRTGAITTAAAALEQPKVGDVCVLD